jgi:hypothetical protein
MSYRTSPITRRAPQASRIDIASAMLRGVFLRRWYHRVTPWTSWRWVGFTYVETKRARKLFIFSETLRDGYLENNLLARFAVAAWDLWFLVLPFAVCLILVSLRAPAARAILALHAWIG